MIIAIDGPSGTGKSTVAKGVAARLGFTFFDTGAMYRSIAWWVIEEKIDPADEKSVLNALSTFTFQIETDEEGGKRYRVNGVEVTAKIRTEEVSRIASRVSTYRAVREEMVKIQREFARTQDAVFEGRDMGTVVFPQADLKVFLTASPEVRAKRRYQELVAKFPDLSDEASLEQIQKDLELRDQQDTQREISPLRQAPDAISIDTSELKIEEVIDQILHAYYRALDKPPFSPMKFSYRLVHEAAKLFLKLFYRLEIHGIENYQPGPGLLAANHASFLDPPILSACCPEEVHFVAKEELFKVPFLGWLIQILNSHPVGSSSSDAATLKLMVNLVKEGKKVILFPEGSRSMEGDFEPFQEGLAFLAYKAGAPVYPVYIHGAYAIWNRHRKFPRWRGKLACVFGKPIALQQFAGLAKKEALRAITEKTKEAIAELRKNYLAKESVRPR